MSGAQGGGGIAKGVEVQRQLANRQDPRNRRHQPLKSQVNSENDYFMTKMTFYILTLNLNESPSWVTVDRDPGHLLPNHNMQSQKSKQISLKGSTAIVTDFFKFAVNT
jgi:hypothetical protein